MTNISVPAEQINSPSPLSPTGERFLPQVMSGNVELEHLHRYALACELAHGKVVLDIASGEGYGSHLLAKVAESVIGVDISPDAVAHAKSAYSRTNLEFRQGSCVAIPVAEHSIDLAVSFETIEHHDQHEEMLAELKRVLKPDGILVISTPDKLHYFETSGTENEFHVKELHFEEFRTLLGAHFRYQEFLGQKVHYGSLVVPAAPSATQFHIYGGAAAAITRTDSIIRPIYYIALASDLTLPAPSSSLFDGTKAFSDLLRQTAAQLSETQHELEVTKQRFENTINSIYWRITFPLRLLRKGFKFFLGI